MRERGLREKIETEGGKRGERKGEERGGERGEIERKG